MFNRVMGTVFSTTASLMQLIPSANPNNPHVKKLDDLNKAVQTIKELDGTRNLVAESDQAIDILQAWKTHRDSDNNALAANALNMKRMVLGNASVRFSMAKYLCMAGSALNILTTFYLFSLNENNTFAEDPTVKMGINLGLMATAMEGSIHLYKAKRHYIQMEQLAKVELQSVNKATLEKNREVVLKLRLDQLLEKKTSSTDEDYFVTKDDSGLYTLIQNCFQNIGTKDCAELYGKISKEIPLLVKQGSSTMGPMIQSDRAKLVKIILDSGKELDKSGLQAMYQNQARQHLRRPR